ncbi:MAG: hypothetical protein LBH41_01485 [Rickettsiales bacterium]|jgi:type IV secretory pathway VirB10-like protein|nr:hypothetical protein [Rickettsiales bacterium]
MFGFKKKSTKAAALSGDSISPEKQSAAALEAKGTNMALATVSITMLAIFAAGALLMSSKKKEAEAAGDEPARPAADVANQFDKVEPVLSSNPESVLMRDARAGEQSEQQILIYSAGAPAKIVSVFISGDAPPGLAVEEDCTAKESVAPSSSCMVDLRWTPEEAGTKSLFLSLRWTEAIANEYEDKTFNIPLELASSGSIPASGAGSESAASHEDGAVLPGGGASAQASAAAGPAMTASAFDDEEYEDEDLDEEFYDDEDEEDADDPALAGASLAAGTGSAAGAGGRGAAQRTIFPADCKRYASKAYDFSGVFLGWTHANKDVFSPNCSRLIGSLSDDGMVVAAGTGKIIGKGVVMDKKKSDERRIELALPVLREVQSNIDSDNFQPNIEDVIANREAAKTGDIGRPCEEDDGCNRASDPLGIMNKKRNSLVPFTITEESGQVSSMPKDERFVLRQGKPIPAVLVRPIYVSALDDEGSAASPDNLSAIAQVERHVYGGDGRTVIIPSGSQLIGEATPPDGAGAQTLQKIEINWHRLIRPDGAEFNLLELQALGNSEEGMSTLTADAQGRKGVPGRNDTQYMKNLLLKPLLYSALPVALEAMFPTTSQFVQRARRSDGTYQVWDDDSGDFNADLADAGDPSYFVDPDQTETIMNMTSRDKMKMEIQQNVKSVTQKMIEESLRQRVPFTVPTGTRMQVYLNNDIMLRIDEDMSEMLNQGY